MCIRDSTEAAAYKVKVTKDRNDDLPETDLTQQFKEIFTQMERTFAKIADLDYERGEVLDDPYTFANKPGARYLIQKMLEEYAEHDSFLKSLMSLLLTDRTQGNQEISTFREEMLHLFVRIYDSKVKRVLAKEYFGFRTLQPLMTKDLLTPYKDTSNLKYVNVLDNYLNSTLRFELNNYLASHVFLAAGFFGLKKLESVYRTLNRSINQNQSKDEQDDIGSTIDKDQLSIVNDLKSKGMKIQTTEQLSEYVKYLNDLTHSLAGLVERYKDKIHFKEDYLISQLLDNETTKTKKVDFDFVEASRELYNQSQKEISNLINVIISKNEGRPNNPIFMDLIQRNLVWKSGDELDFQRTKDALEDMMDVVSPGSAEVKAPAKYFQGAMKYVTTLTEIHNKAYFGDLNFLPNEFDIVNDQKVVPQELRNIDWRESEEEWFRDRLHRLIKQLFELRDQLSRGMTRDDCLVLDRDLAHVLSPETLKDSMIQSLNNDAASFRLIRETLLTITDDYAKHEEVQINKFPNLQKVFDENVKNPQAYDQFITLAINSWVRQEGGKKLEPSDYVNTLYTSERVYRNIFKESKKGKTRPDEIVTVDKAYRHQIDRKLALHRKKPYKLDTDPRSTYAQDLRKTSQLEALIGLKQLYEDIKDNPLENKLASHLNEYFTNKLKI
eukprot:TRINITY_DN9591_c0_g3_i11.p1 TRINITY_DN9591_c0_g3~~TRINITY_DN9591_c0_g3_i11.p1  ORF type:complete len:696 (+),score=155.11 TRINITY_DN9591_c0_g3_i11:91-2088(+)